MADFRRQFARAIATGGLTILLFPAAQAQSFPGRPRRGMPQPDQQPAAQATPAPQSAAPAQPSVAPSSQPAPAAAPPSMLLQPAQEAKILFASNSLSIHADNSSLIGILRQFAVKSGMRLDGLSGDERVFGSFGPGAPRDVLADLLNGTAYNVVMVGDLNNGAPRELILSPSTKSGGTPAPAAEPAPNPDEPSNDLESTDASPPAPDVPPPQANTPTAPPGVRTPQQLFEQLQRMRQGQQQQQDQQPQQQAPQ